MQDTTVVSAHTSSSAVAYPMPAADSQQAATRDFYFEDAAIATPAKRDTTKPVTYINFYSGHELKVKHAHEIPYKDASPDWLFYVLLLVVAALAWIRYFFGKIFGQTLQAIFNVNITNQIVRDENVLLQRTSSFMGVIFNVVFAVVLYHVSNYFRWNLLGIENPFGRFLFLLLTVSAVYSFKFLLLKLLGFIFSVEREMATYIFNIFLINNMLGIVLIPVAVLLSFSIAHQPGLFVVAACVLYGMALIYRFFRGFVIGLSYKGVNLMYLFLYFCALEFAPVLVLLKIVSG